MTILPINHTMLELGGLDKVVCIISLPSSHNWGSWEAGTIPWGKLRKAGSKRLRSDCICRTVTIEV